MLEVGDRVTANDDIREPLGEHLVNAGKAGIVVRVFSEGKGPFPYEILWDNSRKTTFVAAYEVSLAD